MLVSLLAVALLAFSVGSKAYTKDPEVVQFINPPIEAFTGVDFKPNPLIKSLGEGLERQRKDAALEEQEKKETADFVELLKISNPSFRALTPDLQFQSARSARRLGPTGIKALLGGGDFENLAGSVDPGAGGGVGGALSALGNLFSGQDRPAGSLAGAADFTDTEPSFPERFKAFVEGDDSLERPTIGISQTRGRNRLPSDIVEQPSDIGAGEALGLRFTRGRGRERDFSDIIEAAQDAAARTPAIEPTIGIRQTRGRTPIPRSTRAQEEPRQQALPITQTRGRARKQLEAKTESRRPANLLNSLRKVSKTDARFKDADFSLSNIKKEAKKLGIHPNELIRRLAEKMGI